MNAEVVARLQESFEARRPSEEVTSRLNALSTDLSMAIALIGELREMAEERQREQNMPTGDLDSELPSVSIKKNEKKA